MQNDVCQWAQDDDGIWQTECGNAFEIMNGTPKENEFNYCTYCGKELCEVRE